MGNQKLLAWVPGWLVETELRRAGRAYNGAYSSSHHFPSFQEWWLLTAHSCLLWPKELLCSCLQPQPPAIFNEVCRVTKPRPPFLHSGKMKKLPASEPHEGAAESPVGYASQVDVFLCSTLLSHWIIGCIPWSSPPRSDLHTDTCFRVCFSGDQNMARGKYPQFLISLVYL